MPHMLKNKGGVIVNVAVDGGEARRPRLLGALCRGQGRGEHHDAGRGARIRQGQHPLPVDLAGADQHRVPGVGLLPRALKRFLDDMPMGRFGEPEEIGELVLFMCSDACPFMTADTVLRQWRRRLALSFTE